MRKDCFTIGGYEDIKRVNRYAKNKVSNHFKIAFGDVEENSLFDKCMTSLTVPSITKVTASLIYNDKEQRLFNLFSYIEDITLDDLFSKKVERITLVRETSDKRTLYTTNFKAKDEEIVFDYYYFALRKETVFSLFRDIKSKEVLPDTFFIDFFKTSGEVLEEDSNKIKMKTYKMDQYR